MKLKTVYEVLKGTILAYILVYEDGTDETKKPHELMDELAADSSKYPGLYLKEAAHRGRAVGVDKTKIEFIEGMRWEAAKRHIADRNVQNDKDVQRNLFGLFKKDKDSKYEISECEKEYLISEILKIGADPEQFRFNEHSGIVFVDHKRLIYINKIIFSLPGSQPPEYDLSIRGILAHEY